MFLKDLSSNEAKQLFGDLSLIVCMASGDKETAADFVKEELQAKDKYFYNEDYYTQFYVAISQEEIDMYLLYRSELNSGSFDGDSYNSFDYDGNFLERIINRISEDTLEQYKDNPQIKQQAMQVLASEKEDLFNITPELIQHIILLLPEVRQQILTKSARELIKNKDRYLTTKDKKILLFELIGIGYSSGQFEQEERFIIEEICNLLTVDFQYINDFEDILQRMLPINLEAYQIINE
ncbi:hypothetical protein [Rappaport israeli]|uniref:hypothetical protein n=1 Tax=Rappaport israeli TaxID=1839807 RepID=UPI00093120CE|nr:hypothetical protein [Rappaport israeli]